VIIAFNFQSIAINLRGKVVLPSCEIYPSVITGIISSYRDSYGLHNFFISILEAQKVVITPGIKLDLHWEIIPRCAFIKRDLVDNVCIYLADSTQVNC
jgi:hypothetical protein